MEDLRDEEEGYEYPIPEEIKASLGRYVERGIPTGGFLQAVLENDLKGALGRADHINRPRLHEIVSYVYNELPSACQGSPEKVQSWLAKWRQS